MSPHPALRDFTLGEGVICSAHREQECSKTPGPALGQPLVGMEEGPGEVLAVGTWLGHLGHCSRGDGAEPFTGAQSAPRDSCFYFCPRVNPEELVYSLGMCSMPGITVPV